MVDEGVNVHALSWIVGVKGVVIAVVGVIHDQAAVVGKENKAKGVHAVHIHAILKPVEGEHPHLGLQTAAVVAHVQGQKMGEYPSGHLGAVRLGHGHVPGRHGAVALSACLPGVVAVHVQGAGVVPVAAVQPGVELKLVVAGFGHFKDQGLVALAGARNVRAGLFLIAVHEIACIVAGVGVIDKLHALLARRDGKGLVARVIGAGITHDNVLLIHIIGDAGAKVQGLPCLGVDLDDLMAQYARVLVVVPLGVGPVAALGCQLAAALCTHRCRPEKQARQKQQHCE